jgi:cytochrome c biogenesis protein CcmG, thiol:disulfide interchange protein DsbE
MLFCESFVVLIHKNSEMKNLILSAFILFSSIVFAQNGQTMPGMILKDINGKNVNTADYSKNGKITIISFWATWCTPCKKELTNINDNMLDDWKAKYDVVMVAVCTDDSKNLLKVKPFVDGQSWDFDCLLDVNKDLQRSLNALLIPFTVLLDRNGKIVYTHTGYNEGDEFLLEEKIKAILAKK